jgi:hypothetical protein
MLRLLYLLFCLSLASCVPVLSAKNAPVDPQSAFWSRLSALCGKAFAGGLISNEAPDTDMAGKAMVMQISYCSPREIRIPFHIRTGGKGGVADGEDAWDRSRTWIVTRTTAGQLRLKHDHRHRDGSVDAVTQYGGDSTDLGIVRADGSAWQAFPIDAESKANFLTNGLNKSLTNVWSIGISAPATSARKPTPKFTYILRREGANARWFEVAFDLRHNVTPPPAAWGW